MQSFALLPKSTALVLIDLQKGITSFSVEPRSSAKIIENATNVAKRFRDLGAPVFLVRVAFPSGEAALELITDAQPPLPASEPEGWLEFAIQNIFPRLGRVRSTQEILQALGGGK
jgi:nicotinamidase-related amidase